MNEPTRRNDIKNSTTRFWTKAELKETKKQAKEGGFEVSKVGFSGTVTIINPENNDLVLKAMEGPGGMMMVRFDQSYFEA